MGSLVDLEGFVENLNTERSRSDDDYFFKTGISPLDSLMCGGIPNGSLVIVGGRPGEGKTTLALQIASMAKKGAVLFSLEMPDEHIKARMLTRDSGVEAQKIINRSLSDDDISLLRESAKKVKNIPIVIHDDLTISTDEICSRALSQEDVDVVIIDFLQIIDEVNSSDDKNSALGVVTRKLKKLARDINKPVIALSQLKRGNLGKPVLTDLRDSGNLESDADMVLFVYRTATQKRVGETGIILAKSKNGSRGDVSVAYDETKMSYMSDPKESKEVLKMKSYL